MLFVTMLFTSYIVYNLASKIYGFTNVLKVGLCNKLTALLKKLKIQMFNVDCLCIFPMFLNRLTVTLQPHAPTFSNLFLCSWP